MNTFPLHIFVDSREPSVSFARHLKKSISGGCLGTVEHIREQTLLSRLDRVLNSCGGRENLVLISMHYLSPATLTGLTRLLERHGFPPGHVIVTAYDCFTHIAQWCEDTGCRFVANPYKKRELKQGIEESLPFDDDTAVLPVGLERIWVQYRLMVAIISRNEHLGIVSRELIQGVAASGSTLADEYRRAFRYFKLGEPDMAGGSYSCEQVRENSIDRLRSRINKVSATDFNVLIRGESGTGKEAVAWAIHELSNRRDKPFLVINCAGLPDDLLESEMFGYKKGSHNQAWDDQPGVVATASGGTLFLDELPDMSARIQAKLLRFIESGEYRPLGGGRNRYADVRIIAAGQPQRIDGVLRVRPDLKSRIGQLELELLPLRDLERLGPGTVYKIAFVLLERYMWTSIYRDRNCHELTPADIRRYQDKLARRQNMSRLLARQWQDSNVRELNNFLRQWIVFGEGEMLQLNDGRGVETGREKKEDEVLVHDRALRALLTVPHDRRGLKRLFADSPMKQLKHAYARHIFTVYQQIVEQENMAEGSAKRATQKELAKLMGITENSLSRYLN